MRTKERSGTGLLGKVALLHYEHGLTHHEIGSMLGLSRVKVTRLLAEARRERVVEITVHADDHVFHDVEQRLAERFGLRQAWVGPTVTGEDRARSSLGTLGAQCLHSLLTERRTVTVGLSASIAAVVEHVGPVETRPDFVPATGSTGGRSLATSSLNLALGLAARTGGHAYHLPTPLLASTAATATALRAESAVREVLDRAASAELLVAGLGAMGNDSRMLIDDMTGPELEAARERGAVGDVCARFFDAAGRHVPTGIDERIIGLDADALRGIPDRMVVARGTAKITALRAALRGGLPTVLVTDLATARTLLSDDDATDATGAAVTAVTDTAGTAG